MKKLSGAEMVVQSLRDWIFMMQSILLVGLNIF